MGRVGIAIHRFREDAVATGREIIEWCAAHGHVPVVAAADLPTLSASGGLPGVETDDLLEGIDVLVSIGGDAPARRFVAAASLPSEIGRASCRERVCKQV